VPAHEELETRNKARALLAAVPAARRMTADRARLAAAGLPSTGLSSTGRAASFGASGFAEAGADDVASSSGAATPPDVASSSGAASSDLGRDPDDLSDRADGRGPGSRGRGLTVAGQDQPEGT
ncbi:MAG: hypothetical protein ACR2LA_09935, partial [Acidimicrobiales bacterium]